MTFKKNWILRYRCTEHLCVSFYDEIDGVAQKQGAPLSVGALLRRGDLGSRRVRHAAFFFLPRRASQHTPGSRRPRSHRFHLRIHCLEPWRGPVLLSPGKPALHREDKVEKPLQNGNGTVAIPLRRARAHGRGRSPACRNRFGDSGNRRKSRLYQAGCIYGCLPKGQGLHAHAVQKAALAFNPRTRRALSASAFNLTARFTSRGALSAAPGSLTRGAFSSSRSTLPTR